MTQQQYHMCRVKIQRQFVMHIFTLGHSRQQASKLFPHIKEEEILKPKYTLLQSSTVRRPTELLTAGCAHC